MADAPGVVIRQAETEEDVAVVRVLILAFVEWCRVRYAERPWQVETYFAEPAFSQSLDRLAIDYVPPEGVMLIAELNGAPVGTVSYRAHSATLCELKRLFVAPAGQGNGIGRALCDALFGIARTGLHTEIRLETGDLQPEANALYHALGFVETPPFVDHEPRLAAHMIFMARPL